MTNIKSLTEGLPCAVKFVHLGYIVDNREKQMPYFKDMMGIDDFLCYDYTPDVAFLGDGSPVKCRLKLALGASPVYGFSVELIEPESNSLPHSDYLSNSGTHLNHIAYMVDDYDAAKKAFLALNGSSLIFEADFTDDIKGRRRSFYFTADEIPGIVEITEKPTLST